jgi:thioesterase domain-containing protein
LAALWRDLLKLPRVGRFDNFFELGGHSLLAMQLVHRCGEVFARRPSLRSLFEHPTLAAFARVIDRGTPPAFAHLVPLQPGRVEAPLFCIHPAGGAVFCYQPLAAALDQDESVYGLQARGLEPEERAATSVEQMAAQYVAEIRMLQPTGPYHLLGWSFGGLVAYEMARQLQAEGERVALLALLDTALEQPDLADSEVSDKSIIETLIDVLGLEKIIPDAACAIANLDEFVEAARQSGIWPTDFSTVQAARIIELFKLNIAQGRTYVPGGYDGDILLFRALDNPEGGDFDWSAKTTGNVRLVPLATTHNRVPFDPNARVIADVLRPLLARERPAK